MVLKCTIMYIITKFIKTIEEYNEQQMLKSQTKIPSMTENFIKYRKKK